MNDQDDKASIVLAAFKEAQKRPLQLSPAEIIELVFQPRYLGVPEKIKAKARGRKPKKNQYDVWYERRKNLYQKLVRLPNLRKGSAGYGFAAQILQIARSVINPRKRVAAVQKELQLRGLPTPDESNLRKFLRKNNL